jgi:hypothetical protein
LDWFIDIVQFEDLERHHLGFCCVINHSSTMLWWQEKRYCSCFGQKRQWALRSTRAQHLSRVQLLRGIFALHYWLFLFSFFYFLFLFFYLLLIRYLFI